MDGTVVLCQAGSAAAFRARASTAWEGGPPAFFVVAGRARGRLLYFASAALSFESAAEETGRRELWLARPISWTARELCAESRRCA